MTTTVLLGETGRMSVRLLIVDDHAGFRAVARLALESGGYEVVGEAADGAQAITAATRLRPEVVLLDVHLPDADGFTVCRRLAALADAPKVVLVSSRPITDLRQLVADSPALGFLAKHELSGGTLTALVGRA